MLLAWPWKGPPSSLRPWGALQSLSVNAERMTEHETEMLKGKKTGETKSTYLVPLWVMLVQRKSAPTVCPTPGLFPHNAKVKGHEITDSVPVTRSGRQETGNTEREFSHFSWPGVGAVRLREVPKGHGVRSPRFPCERTADASPADFGLWPG